jgi:ligand-binding SRPBCC domain-containing protein
MPTFDYSFTVKAPLTRVAGFHHDTRVLKRLTPFPVIVQIHRVEPLAEGSISDFTLWFGPLPVHWVAIHSKVEPLYGFTDTQQQGPLKRWAHSHTFRAEGENLTRVSEHIEYEHYGGLKGLLSRLLFPKPGLYLLFTYRKMVTRWLAQKKERAG